MKIDLQVHPFFENYRLHAIWYAMFHNQLDATSLLNYNVDSFPEIWDETKKLPRRFETEGDNLLIKVQQGNTAKYFIRGIEVLTEDNFHLILFGYEGVPPRRYAEEAIEHSLEKGALVIIDHPFALCTNTRLEIPPSQEKKLESLCRKFSGRLALEKNGYCNPRTRRTLGGQDVNEKATHLSHRLYSEGFNIPLISTTDLHARNLRLLKAIGTAHIRTDLDVSSGTDFIRSLKTKIFKGEYINHHRYPSLPHFIEAFGIPVALNLYRNRG